MLSKMSYEMIAIGEMLQDKCPQNDCVIYRNTYAMWDELTEDLQRVKGTYTKTVLKFEIEKLENELYRMYITNYAVREYVQGRKRQNQRDK